MISVSGMAKLMMNEYTIKMLSPVQVSELGQKILQLIWNNVRKNEDFVLQIVTWIRDQGIFIVRNFCVPRFLAI